MEVKLVSRSPDETDAIGRWLGQRLWPGAFLALTGDLGSGKTVLATGILAGLGVQRSGGSPTFPLLWEYSGGRLPAYHWDVDRIERVEELEQLDYADTFYGDGVCVVEWADQVRPLWPAEHLWVALAPAASGVRPEDPDHGRPAPAGPVSAGPQAWRVLRFTAVGGRYSALLGELAHAGFGA